MFKIKKLTKRKIYNNLKDVYQYNFNDFNINVKDNSLPVDVYMVGTGVPIHYAFNNIVDFEVFDEKTDNPDDLLNISTIVGGIILGDDNDRIKGYKSSVKGFMPSCFMTFIKTYNDDGIATESSIVSSLLWAAIKKAELIIMNDYYKQIDIVGETINKVSKDIPLLMPHAKGNMSDNCIYCSYKKGKNGINIEDNHIIVSYEVSNFYSLYGEASYCKTPDNLVALGVSASLLIALIQDIKYKKNVSLVTKDELLQSLSELK
ncbi:MAG: hypothetical protein WDA06_05845 [Phenylobacterium sp.]